MIFDKIRLVGANTMEFKIVGALPSDPYILKAVDGLGPPDMDVFMADVAEEGALYQGRRIRGRQPILTLGLNPNYRMAQTVSDLRDALYNLISTDDSRITLEILSGDQRKAYVICFVSNIDTTIFTKDPAIQITFTSPDSYLKGDQYIVETVPGNISSFEFVNPGTALAGFELVFTPDSTPTNGLQIRVGNRSFIHLPVTITRTTTLNTNMGQREVTWYDGTDTRIMKYIADDSEWPYLRPGVNLIEFLNPVTDLPYSMHNVELTMLPRYLGV